jgi:autotransporter-associated beta strand protein
MISGPMWAAENRYSGGITLNVSLTVNATTNFGTYLSNITGAITGGGGIVKTGAGRFQMGAVNTYLGGTIVSNGTVETTAATSLGSGSVRVANGGTLLSHHANAATDTTGKCPILIEAGGRVGGKSTIGGEMTIQGILAPGAGLFDGALGPTVTNSAVGTLYASSNVVISAGATIDWQRNLTANDLLVVGRNLELPATGTVKITLLSGATLPEEPVLCTAKTLSGATDLSGWTSTGVRGYTLAVKANTPAGTGWSVILKMAPSATVILIR